MSEVRLKKGKEKAVRQLHPWIFSGAIEHINGKPENGDIVDVRDHSGEFLAKGFYNDQSRVAVRLLEWNEQVTIDESWWRMRVQRAVSARKDLLSATGTNTYRLIFSEADFLPGLIVDRYADYLSVQILTSGIEKVKGIIVDELVSLLNVKGVFDRSDASARAHDGMDASFGILYGEEPPQFVEVLENGLKYHINIAEGQKSGFFCDQRENRRIVAGYAEGKRVLDCFSYSGGFTLNALKIGAAEVTSVDSSALAVETLKQNIVLNSFDEAKHTAIQSDVNKYLRVLKEEGQKFDIIVLDPPKYAPSRSSLDKASRAYKDLNRMAMGLLNSGGLLATFSCSGAVDISHFKQILAWAALDAGKEIQYIYQFCQPEDHPVRSSFPEGEYLKGLFCRIV
ncbi:23S rRNA (cytosine1962-C5)-methyltransferase [Arcticibacter pallidicorallinus]|uniref:23S rRNA (Cytosine1962-C5)-methyltransferase n=1 Tax=Arcticibacter pallidicorallinus TaxID=1259464 RepID=A0A2T0U758_9SPHI|nr:class I SAM-dependent rRNA methyltransferase [Arcticibacter pallidicorallinus]PRY53750.1 23S rRNA (cytosine1962-C5)-methyltransferase [Arcticibacter pallidicorallinus]